MIGGQVQLSLEDIINGERVWFYKTFKTTEEDWADAVGQTKAELVDSLVEAVLDYISSFRRPDLDD